MPLEPVRIVPKLDELAVATVARAAGGGPWTAPVGADVAAGDPPAAEQAAKTIAAMTRLSQVADGTSGGAP